MSSKSVGDCTKTKKLHILLVNNIPTPYTRFERSMIIRSVKFSYLCFFFTFGHDQISIFPVSWGKGGQYYYAANLTHMI